MIDQTAMNPLLRRVVPPLAAVVLIAAFVSLGFWQLDRASQKEALAAMFAADAPFRDLADDYTPVPFERLATRGRLLSERQILIDNIVRNGRVGYYVITPLERMDGRPPLLVNRGWIDKQQGIADPAIDVAGDWRLIRGRAGGLPRVGIRAGDPFTGGDWPRVAVYPTIDEVAAELGGTLAPFVLLLDADEPDGFVRTWEPAQSGPMTHYGYAFQWFAMAAAVVAIAAWQLRRRRGASG